jgi:hypothetical protein
MTCQGVEMLGAWLPEFHTMVPNTFSILTACFAPYIVTCRSNAPTRKHQITLKFICQSRILNPQYEMSFKSPFWHLKFGGGS